MGYAALAKVLTSLPGGAVVSTGSLSVSVAPVAFDSVASFMARIVRAAATIGLTLTVSLSASGIFTVSGSAVFGLVFSGGLEADLGMSASNTGATLYAGSSAFTGAYVPAFGLRLDGVMLRAEAGASVDDGFAVAPTERSAETRLQVWDDQITIFDTTAEWDVTIDGRVLGRVAVRSVTRFRLSALVVAPEMTRLDIDCFEVA